jgi:nicotinamidase-related amidase
MQRVFAARTPWHTPWMPRVLPVICRLAERWPQRTFFTRFLPPARPERAHGSWRRYYERWRELTLENAGPELFDLVPELAAFVPPGLVFEKSTYAPWGDPEFDQALRQRNPDALITTGAETDVCVLATVLGAVDRGYRVVIPVDALCSSSDTTHDALLTLYNQRFSEQIETATTEEVLAAWR